MNKSIIIYSDNEKIDLKVCKGENTAARLLFKHYGDLFSKGEEDTFRIFDMEDYEPPHFSFCINEEKTTDTGRQERGVLAFRADPFDDYFSKEDSDEKAYLFAVNEDGMSSIAFKDTEAAYHFMNIAFFKENEGNKNDFCEINKEKGEASIKKDGDISFLWKIFTKKDFLHSDNDTLI